MQRRSRDRYIMDYGAASMVGGYKSRGYFLETTCAASKRRAAGGMGLGEERIRSFSTHCD